MTLVIYALGALRVQRGENTLSDNAWKTLKHKALLEILLTFRKHPLTREQLIEWLWAHLEPDAADRNLRVTISQLRHALAPPDLSSAAQCILTTDAGYAWNLTADYWLDADEFETLCVQSERAPDDTGLAERAYALYRADYLEQERYAEWATAERERLREMFFALLTRMADLYARRGQYRRAIALAREILAADRCRESVWCQLMLYHYHAGDAALALRAFDECRTALAQELEIEPLVETTALAEQIRRRRVMDEPAYPPPIELERLRQLPVSLSHLAFVGREAEWRMLMHAWNAAQTEPGQVVLLEGEAGVGKTRLAEQLLAFARTQGAIVLEGKGRELSGALPYQPLIDALRASPQPAQAALTLDPLWRVELGRLVPEWSPLQDAATSPAPPGGDQSRLFEAVTRLLRELASRAAPLVLFLDDAQWFDEATINFLAYWSRQAGPRVLVLTTARTEQAAPDTLAIWWTELQRTRALTRLTLTPLTQQAIAQLVEAASHASPMSRQIAAWLYQESGGYPLFLVAQLQALFEDGLLYADGQGAWFGAESLFSGDTLVTPLPPMVTDVLSQRVQRLDTRVQRMLGVAAVIGRPFDLELLERAARQTESELLDELDQALQRRALRTLELSQGTNYEFSHDLIRRTVYNALAPDRRAQLHRRVLEALEQTAGRGASNVMELAYHAEHGRVWHSAIHYAIQAAEWALDRYAIQEAGRQCERGLAALDAFGKSSTAKPNSRELLLWRYDLLAAKQLAAHLLGKRETELLDQMRELAQELQDPERLAKAYYALMRHYIDTGQNNAALELLPAYEPLVAQGISTQAALGFHQRVGFLYYRVGDFERAQVHHDQALQLAAHLSDAHWQAYVLNSRGSVLMCLGRYQDAIADFTRAAEIWQTPTREIFREFALDNCAEVLYYCGQYESALAAKEQALARYREFGYPIAEAECLSEIGVTLRELGRTAAAENYLKQGIALSEKLGDSFDLVQSLIGLAGLYLGSDKTDEWEWAARYAARAVAEGERANLPHAVIQGLAYGAFAQLRLGHPDAGLALSARAVALLEQRQHIEGAEEEIYYLHSRLLQANGRAQDAHLTLERAFSEMMTKADALTDPALKISFLERVRVNRAIQAAL